MFKVGDKVAPKKNPPSRKFKFKDLPSIPSIIPSITKKRGAVEVKGTAFCIHCGGQLLDFDHSLPSEYSDSTHTACCDCGNNTPFAYPRVWYRALDFERVIYNNISAEIVDKISDVKETSDQPILNPNPKPEEVKVNS